MRHSPTFSSRTMRLQRPDDELGGMLLLAVPSVVVHRIDNWSPLMPPPPLREDEEEADEDEDEDDDEADEESGVGVVTGNTIKKRTTRRQRVHDASTEYKFPDIAQRESDLDNGSREAQTKRKPKMDLATWKEEIRVWMETSGSEVLVLVEGEENMTGCSLQARHSYTIDDIVSVMCGYMCIYVLLNIIDQVFICSSCFPSSSDFDLCVFDLFSSLPNFTLSFLSSF
jgi:hypothetical protein